MVTKLPIENAPNAVEDLPVEIQEELDAKPTIDWVHRTIIVSAEIRDVASYLCEQAAGPGGSNMFTTPLSASGQEPATHFVSAGPINVIMAGLLASPENMYDALRVFDVTLEQCQAILAASDITDEPADSAYERLGLRIIQGETE